MPTITPFLWLHGDVREAAAFYASVFGDAVVEDGMEFPESSPGKVGEIMSTTVDVRGQRLTLFNGGAGPTLTEGFSLFVECHGQDEVDRYWDALVEGGTPNRCGWLTDRFGVTWQIVPDVLGDYLGGPDAEGRGRAMQAMLGMVKLDIAGLRSAYEGTA
jgi:predicted 3-demethylubiquinone-9 3-methyltransferase (glyoxalase superfamily)